MNLGEMVVMIASGIIAFIVVAVGLIVSLIALGVALIPIGAVVYACYVLLTG